MGRAGMGSAVMGSAVMGRAVVDASEPASVVAESEERRNRDHERLSVRQGWPVQRLAATSSNTADSSF